MGVFANNPKAFLKERARKLLVPSTLGLFVVHWITGYLNLKIGGALEFMPSFLVYPISVLSGGGPLWFIQVLFFFSVIMLLIRKLDKKDSLWKLGSKANTVVLILLFVVIWGAAQVLNMPILTTYCFGIYLLALVSEFMLTPICYEIIRRIPIIRYLVLGYGK